MLNDLEIAKEFYKIPLGNGSFVRTWGVGNILESHSKQLIEDITSELNKLEEVGKLRRNEYAPGAVNFDISDPKDKRNPKATLYALLSLEIDSGNDDDELKTRLWIQGCLKIDPILNLRDLADSSNQVIRRKNIIHFLKERGHGFYESQCDTKTYP